MLRGRMALFSLFHYGIRFRCNCFCVHNMMIGRIAYLCVANHLHNACDNFTATKIRRQQQKSRLIFFMPNGLSIANILRIYFGLVDEKTLICISIVGIYVFNCAIRRLKENNSTKESTYLIFEFR